jgi:hypothetical protein
MANETVKRVLVQNMSLAQNNRMKNHKRNQNVGFTELQNKLTVADFIVSIQHQRAVHIAIKVCLNNIHVSDWCFMTQLTSDGVGVARCHHEAYNFRC